MQSIYGVSKDASMVKPREMLTRLVYSLYLIPRDLANTLVHVANHFLEHFRSKIEIAILATRACVIDLIEQCVISVSAKRRGLLVFCLTLTVAEPLGPFTLILRPHHLLFLFMLPYCLWFKATIIELLFSFGPHAP